MDKFLEKCNFPKENKEGGESLHRIITTGKIEAVIKKFLAHKSPGPDSFTEEFYKAFKEELTPTLLIQFQKIQEEGRLPTPLMRPILS